MNKMSKKPKICTEISRVKIGGDLCENQSAERIRQDRIRQSYFTFLDMTLQADLSLASAVNSDR